MFEWDASFAGSVALKAGTEFNAGQQMVALPTGHSQMEKRAVLQGFKRLI